MSEPAEAVRIVDQPLSETIWDLIRNDDYYFGRSYRFAEWLANALASASPSLIDTRHAYAEGVRDATSALTSALAARDEEIARLREALSTAKWDGENAAYTEVVRQGHAIGRCDGNDFSDRRAILTFVDRFIGRAALSATTRQETSHAEQG